MNHCVHRSSSSQPIISNPENDDFAYTATVPRITDGTQVRFVARADGSAENILLKLDGGIDFTLLSVLNSSSWCRGFVCLRCVGVFLW